MAKKQGKSIKRLEKQVEKLAKRIDELSRLVATGQAVPGVEDEPVHHYTEEEVEMADELSDEAEEVADLLEKAKQH